ncbi:MAG: super-infection exclusion protein B [Synergistaceae bacterium]|nr:super-infection exclusion protein B [Synergistaceae bacterium]
MYDEGLMKTIFSLLVIYFISRVIVEVVYGLIGYFAEKRLQHEKEEKIFECEERQRSSDNRLRALLLLLPKEMSSLLRYIYHHSSHAAYIPCNNLNAKSLYENGCLERNNKETLRAWGYSEAAKCFYYKVPADIVNFLDKHVNELGQWGVDRDFAKFEVLKKYQRAGRALRLE